jgi:hypothetical protein
METSTTDVMNNSCVSNVPSSAYARRGMEKDSNDTRKTLLRDLSLCELKSNKKHQGSNYIDDENTPICPMDDSQTGDTSKEYHLQATSSSHSYKYPSVSSTSGSHRLSKAYCVISGQCVTSLNTDNIALQTFHILSKKPFCYGTETQSPTPESGIF